ncbi:hypothetical protein Dimus_003006 [Dionaea muscipula]
MVKKVVEGAMDRAMEREFHTLFCKLRDAINAQEPVHQFEEQDFEIMQRTFAPVRGVTRCRGYRRSGYIDIGDRCNGYVRSAYGRYAQPTSVVAEVTDVAATAEIAATSVVAKDTNVAVTSVPVTDAADTSVVPTDVATTTSVGTTDLAAATSVGTTDLAAATSVLLKVVPEDDDKVAIALPNATDDRTRDGQNQHINAYMVYLTMRSLKKGNLKYTLIDSYFFTYISKLWNNWNPNSQPDPSLPPKILEHFSKYVWGHNPEWGIEWWNVHHVSVSRVLGGPIALVLDHINLEKWTIEIYDSLAHKTPKIPGIVRRLQGYEEPSPNCVRRGWIFSAKRQKKKK